MWWVKACGSATLAALSIGTQLALVTSTDSRCALAYSASSTMRVKLSMLNSEHSALTV
jgi:hypothetical protein